MFFNDKQFLTISLHFNLEAVHDEVNRESTFTERNWNNKLVESKTVEHRYTFTLIHPGVNGGGGYPIRLAGVVGGIGGGKPNRNPQAYRLSFAMMIDTLFHAKVALGTCSIVSETKSWPDSSSFYSQLQLQPSTTVASFDNRVTSTKLIKCCVREELRRTPYLLGCRSTQTK